MRTMTIEYEDGIRVTLARPTLADGQTRAAIWQALGKGPGPTIFGYFITQVVSTENMQSFQKLTACPELEELQDVYDLFVHEIDEAFFKLLNIKISVLNGYTTDDSEKKTSGESSVSSSEAEGTPNP